MEEGEDKNTYIEWYKEVNVVENSCDLEINTITDVVNMDYDDLLPVVDGIVYFLNPIVQKEVKIFEMFLSIIKFVKKNIPIIVVYNNGFSLLPLSVNELLENLWTNYPDLEGFVNLSPNQFNQVLQCLCSSMISGDSPLNFENARMRFPIFTQVANKYFKIAKNEKKLEYYYYAAQAIKKAALIADILKNKKLKKEVKKFERIFNANHLYLKLIKNLKKRFSKIKNLNKKKRKRDNRKLKKKIKDLRDQAKKSKDKR
ncbi:MAG: hypothetical protein EU548_02830 [Promethearchaeota archaeon]|nr:MAG: hypothetical protein EU548_02830 [Candidatus Lokiarchaeota archaeon]